MPRKTSASTLFKRAEKLAKERFGFSSLSPGQRDALCALFNGHDTLAILPTGGGKSAIYQLVGLVRKGLTIIVSPLVALQRDQVDHLRALDATAHLLNSSLSPGERDAVWAELERAKTAFLLLAPEQFSNHETLERLRKLEPSLFVVDEAHCISGWGHDFRPDFGRLGAVIEALRRPQVLALTATAAPPVRSDILRRLRTENAEVVVAGFDRANLHLSVRPFSRCEGKREALLEAVTGGPRPAIVYCATRRETEEIVQALAERNQCGLAYHAGLSAKERDERQSAFMNGECEVFVATVAFGMGVDKPDVRRVYHLDVSESLDSYFQEAGRAGRDGESAEAILFFCEGDLGLRRFQMGSGEAGIRTATHLAAALDDMQAKHIEEVEEQLDVSRSTLRRSLSQLEEAGALSMDAHGEIQMREHLNLRVLKRELSRVDEKAHDWDKSRLEMMSQYAQTHECRSQFVLGYFGEELAHPCGHCDNCDNRENRFLPLPEEAATIALASSPWPVGGQVRHAQWGQGEIMRKDEDTLTVVFDSVGYKTLSRQLVIENDLLEMLSSE